MGFSNGIIAETIVSTYCEDGQPNAAPMGARMLDKQTMTIKVFHSSLTYKNLVSTRCAVVNVTSNIEVFYKTAFKLANSLPRGWFEKAEAVNAPSLRMADGKIEVTVADIKPVDAERTEVVCKVELIKASNVSPQVYCRAQFATIEAIIHATRVQAFLKGDENQKKLAIRLLEIIDVCKEVVNHTASPQSQHAKTMLKLTSMIESWRKLD